MYESIVGALVGVIATYLLSHLDQFRSNFRYKGIAGHWVSLSSNSKYGQVKDRLEFSVTPFGIKLRNIDAPHGWSYIGKGKIIDKRFLVGTWRANKNDSYSSGTFEFIISSQGEFMTGMFTGQDESIGSYIHGWCLGRDKEALKRAVQHLETQNIIPRVVETTLESESFS